MVRRETVGGSSIPVSHPPPSGLLDQFTRNSVEKGVSPPKRMNPSVRRKRPKGRIVARKENQVNIKWGMGGK
jgi:hypothetical protein